MRLVRGEVGVLRFESVRVLAVVLALIPCLVVH